MSSPHCHLAGPVLERILILLLVFPRSLVESSKTISWPLKPAEEATNGGDSAFSASFLALLSFQMQCVTTVFACLERVLI